MPHGPLFLCTLPHITYDHGPNVIVTAPNSPQETHNNYVKHFEIGKCHTTRKVWSKVCNAGTKKMCRNVQPGSPTKTMQVGGVQSKVAKWVAMAEKACRMAAYTQTKIGTAGTGHHWVATDFCFPFQEKKELTKLKTNPERNDLKPDFVLVPPKLFFLYLET